MLVKKASVAFIIFATVCGAWGQSIVLKFEQVADLAIENSYDAKILKAEIDQLIAESRESLQWSNPEISFEQELVQNHGEKEKERVVTIGKTFVLPWAGKASRAAWQSRLEAAEYFQRSQKLKLAGEAKSLYVRLRLLQEKRARLERFVEIIQGSSQVANDRFQEGMYSGLQNRLVQMSLMNLQNSLFDLEITNARLEKDLRIALGLESGMRLILETEFKFVPVVLPDHSQFEEMVTSTPAILALHNLRSSLAHQTDAAKGGILPEVTVSAGYKELNDLLKGYAVGISMPIPLMNRNRAAVEKHQAEQRIISFEAEKLRMELEAELVALTNSLEKYAGRLESLEGSVEKDQKLIEDLLYSFQQGFSELGDLIDGVQLYSETIDSYYETLAGYYETIFSMESLLGRELYDINRRKQ